MFCLEDLGTISRITHKNTCTQWELPNCLAYFPNSAFGEVTPRILSSPLFSAFNCKWRLALVRNGGNDSTEKIGIFLWLVSCKNKEIPNITVKLSLLNNAGDYFKSRDGALDFSGSFGSWQFLETSMCFTYAERLSKSGLFRFQCLMQENMLKTDVLSESFLKSDSENDEKDESNEVSNSADHHKENDQPEPKGIDRLLQNLKKLLHDEQSSDVLLKIGDHEFKAHKAILKVRSRVFECMFQPDTNESITGVVDIPDCKASAFEAFLLYTYTGNAEAISPENVADLYYAADKYEMNDLKSECAEFMEKNLSVSSFCEVMTISFKHSDIGLHKTAVEFFYDNVKKIIKTVQWQMYLKDYPVQANELFIKAIDA